MPRKVAKRLVAGTAAAFLVVGLGPPGPPAAGSEDRPESTTIETDYREDPYLSEEQKKLLDQLADRSEAPVAAQSWPRGGTVGRLELAVPSGLPPDRSRSDHALRFVTDYGTLWKLPDGVQLDVVEEVEAGDCSTVTLTLTVEERPVFNATVTVVLTPEGVVRGVAGRLDGGSVGKLAPARISAAEAATAVRKYLAGRTGESTDDLELPEPAEVVADPYFLTDQDHRAGVGYLFTGRAGGIGDAQVVLVDGGTGTVTLGGTGHQPPNQTVTVCLGSNPTKSFYPYILDPMTQTPAVVDFGQFGTPTQGATATERAYDLLSGPVMADLYGDLDPRRHLRDPEEIPTVGGATTVRFTEYFGGLPVEGARLSVVLLPNGNARFITARYVHFPHARTGPDLPEPDAVAAAGAWYATQECGTDAACLDAVADENLAAPPQSSLVILSSEIFTGTNIPQVPPGQERLAYKVEFPRRVVYWDAAGGGDLYDYPTGSGAIPHRIYNGEEDDRLEVTGGVPAAGITPHLDATRVASWLSALDVFYLGLGRNGYDGRGGLVDIRVRDEVDDNAYWCPAAAVAHCGVRMGLGRSLTSDDVTAHEFTHGVVETTTGFVRGGEPGALNEHYADVMANLAFPDSNPNEWLLAENTIHGAVRDMADPSTYGHPEHYGTMRALCGSERYCVHQWAGVPNRAAVLIADGGVPGSSHPGLGRPTLAKLYLETLTGGLSGSSDLLIHERINTLATCQLLVEDNAVIGGRPLVASDCDLVGRAFATVGLDSATDIGWTVFGGWGEEEVWIRQGLSLYQGCSIADQILHAEDYTGDVRESAVADGLTVNFADEWGAEVTVRGAATDATDREVAYRVWSRWLGTYGTVDVVEVLDRPEGVPSDEDCRRPPGTQRRTLYSSQRVSHWATFFDGHKGDDLINNGVSLPPQCSIASVRGVHYHDWAEPPVGVPAFWVDHGQHGYRINRLTNSPTGLGVSVHWWHSGISSIKARVQYDINEVVGFNCLVPGLQTSP